MRISLALGLLMAGAAQAGTPKASSELREDDGTRHPVSLAFDGLPAVATPVTAASEDLLAAAFLPF